MQMTGTFLMIWVLSVLGLGIYARDNVLAAAPAPVNYAFERLKGMAGTWEAKSPEGKTAIETVQVKSAGPSVMVMINGDQSSMVTTFTPDGEAITGTQYSAANNQPQYVLASSSQDSGVLAFEFKNVSSSQSPSTDELIIRLKDADHHSEEWTWRDNGKDTVRTMEFTRKK